MNSFTDGSAFCPGAPKRVPSDSEKHRRVYTSSNICHSHEWRVDTASGKTLKKRNACLHAVRQAVKHKIVCIYGLLSEGVKIQIKVNFYFAHGNKTKSYGKNNLPQSGTQQTKIPPEDRQSTLLETLRKIPHYQFFFQETGVCDLTKVKNPEKWWAWVSLWSRGQSPLNLLDVYM